MNSIHRLLSAGTVAVFAVALLAGCGSSNSPIASSGVTGTASVPVPSGTTDSPSPSASPSGPATASGLTSCVDNIRVSETQMQGAAGHRSLVLVFNNVGTAACELQGYPGVDLVSATGATIASAQRTLSGMAGGVTAASSLTLAPGASASALVEASAVPGDSRPDCGDYNLKVTPPGQYVSVSGGSEKMPQCDLQVHPVVAGVGGGMR